MEKANNGSVVKVIIEETLTFNATVVLCKWNRILRDIIRAVWVVPAYMLITSTIQNGILQNWVEQLRFALHSLFDSHVDNIQIGNVTV